jgi:SAM-dependent methyltransferase
MTRSTNSKAKDIAAEGVACPLCASATRLVARDLPGYRSDLTFSVRECDSCEVSFAMPLNVDATLYTWIYDQYEHVPGYARYHAYFQSIKREPDPLRFLTDQEGAYWACATYLREARARLGREPRILEVGCGAGYFTYALRQAGFNVTGADISRPAILQAKNHFGDFYQELDVQAPVRPGRVRYDIVVMLEVIEHVASPVTFLRAARNFLESRGELFLTTPNKGIHPAESVWDTDLPPVHLFWFAENSFTALARQLQGEAHFCDFCDFFSTHYFPAARPISTAVPTFSPTGDLLVAVNRGPRQGRSAPPWYRSLVEACGLASPYRKLRERLERRGRWRGSVGPTLAAWMTFSSTLP